MINDKIECVRSEEEEEESQMTVISFVIEFQPEYFSFLFLLTKDNEKETRMNE